MMTVAAMPGQVLQGDELEKVRTALDRLKDPDFQRQMEMSADALNKLNSKLGTLNFDYTPKLALAHNLDFAFDIDAALAPLKGGFAFAPLQSEKADRAREQADRARE